MPTPNDDLAEAIFEHAPVGLVVERDEPAVISRVNGALLAELGHAREALEGRRVAETGLWPDAAERERFVAEVRATGRAAVRDLDLAGPEGRRVPVRVSARRSGDDVIVYVESTRERHEALQRLAESEANLLALIENTDDIIASYDRDVRLLVFNQACADAYQRLLGATLRRGMRTIDLFPAEQRPFWEATNRRALDGETFSIVLQLPGPDGRLRTFESFMNPIRQGAEVAGFSTFTRDITDRVTAEAERLRVEARLGQAQKLEALGTMAGGIAHDFNHCLQVIVGSLALARRPGADVARVQASLTSIDEAATGATELVRQLMSFTRPPNDDLRPLELQPVVEGATRLLRGAIAPTVELRVDIDPACPAVAADPSQINQVVLNLGVNGFQAMSAGLGHLAVSLERADVAPGEASELGVPPGTYARLSVQDDGHGMDDATRARIFDPFFSTGPADRNTGLGLAVVRKIVTQHRGAIKVTSAPARGTRFDVFLPAWARTL